MSKCKCTRMYCMSCEDKCFDDKIENNFYEQKNEEDRRTLICIASAFDALYSNIKKANSADEYEAIDIGSFRINDIEAYDESNEFGTDENDEEYIFVQIFWNDFDVVDIRAYFNTDRIIISPTPFFQVPFHLYVNGSYLTELKRQIIEKTNSNNIEIDFDSIDKFGSNFAENHLHLLHEWLDSDEFGGSLQP